MPCGNCGEWGHNRRTCDVDADAAVIDDIIEYFKEEKDQYLKEEKDECIVCYEAVIPGGNGSVKTKCGHTYCTGCFAEHMRRSSACGYCRGEVAGPITKKMLSPDDKSRLVEDSVFTDETFRMIYTDFYAQVQQNVQNAQIIRSFDQALVGGLCMEILRGIQLDYCVWMTGIKVCERVSYEYEN